MSDISGATVNANDIPVDISGAVAPAAPEAAVAPAAPEAAVAPAAPEAAVPAPEVAPAPEAAPAPEVAPAADAATIRVSSVAGNCVSCTCFPRRVADLSGVTLSVDLSGALPAVIAKFTSDLSGSNIQDIIRALPQIAAAVQELETQEPAAQKLHRVAKALIAACVPEAHRAEADAFAAAHLPVVCDILLCMAGQPAAPAAAAAVPKAEQKAEQKAEAAPKAEVVAKRNWMWCL